VARLLVGPPMRRHGCKPARQTTQVRFDVAIACLAPSSRCSHRAGVGNEREETSPYGERFRIRTGGKANP